MNRKNELNALYDKIIAELKPLQKQFGNDRLRWALNRWALHERKIAQLKKKQAEIADELKRLDQ